MCAGMSYNFIIHPYYSTGIRCRERPSRGCGYSFKTKVVTAEFQPLVFFLLQGMFTAFTVRSLVLELPGPRADNRGSSIRLIELLTISDIPTDRIEFRTDLLMAWRDETV